MGPINEADLDWLELDRGTTGFRRKKLAAADADGPGEDGGRTDGDGGRAENDDDRSDGNGDRRAADGEPLRGISPSRR